MGNLIKFALGKIVHYIKTRTQFTVRLINSLNISFCKCVFRDTGERWDVIYWNNYYYAPNWKFLWFKFTAARVSSRLEHRFSFSMLKNVFFCAWWLIWANIRWRTKILLNNLKIWHSFRLPDTEKRGSCLYKFFIINNPRHPYLFVLLFRLVFFMR